MGKNSGGLAIGVDAEIVSWNTSGVTNQESCAKESILHSSREAPRRGAVSWRIMPEPVRGGTDETAGSSSTLDHPMIEKNSCGDLEAGAEMTTGKDRW